MPDSIRSQIQYEDNSENIWLENIIIYLFRCNGFSIRKKFKNASVSYIKFYSVIFFREGIQYIEDKFNPNTSACFKWREQG